MLVERFNTRSQARFYIERNGGDITDYEREHDAFHTALDEVQRSLARTIKNKVVERAFLPSFIFSDDQVVITIGQDGLLANAAKYVGGSPMIGEVIHFDGQRYLEHWALANFYFHVTMSYALLRQGGVDLGKPDYLAGARP